MSSAPNSGLLRAQGDEEDSEDQPSPSSSDDERRETTIVQNLASAAAGGGTSCTDDNDTVLAVVDDIELEEDRLAHQSNTNDDYSRGGGIDTSSMMPLQQQATPSHASTSTTTHTSTDEDAPSQALMDQVREYNRLHQAHRQQQTSKTETEIKAEGIVVTNDEDRSAHTDHDIQTASLRDLDIAPSSEHKSDTNTSGTAHDSEDEGNRDRDKSVDIDQDILDAQEREFEILQQRRLQNEQEMERQAHWQHAFDRLFPLCHIDGKGRGRFVQNFHLAASTQTDVNTCHMVCASCNTNLYTSPTAVLSFCPICRNITTTIQEGKTPE